MFQRTSLELRNVSLAFPSGLIFVRFYLHNFYKKIINTESFVGCSVFLVGYLHGVLQFSAKCTSLAAIFTSTGFNSGKNVPA